MIRNYAIRQTLKIAMTACILLAFGIAPSLAGKGGPKNTSGGSDGGGSTPPPSSIAAGKVGGEAYSVDVGLTVDVEDLLGLRGYFHLDHLLDFVGDRAVIQIGPIPHVNLSPYGGIDSESLATVNVLDIVSSRTLANVTAGAIGPNKAGSASASVVENLSLLGGLITADILGSYCSSVSDGSGASSDANSILLGLTIGGKSISVSSAPNTKIDLLGKSLLGLPVKVGMVTINEQITGGDGSKSSSITNNVLHVSISNPNILSLLIGEIVDGEVVISSAHCDVAVNGQNGDEPPAETGDFVTGGGKIDSPTGFATFGFNARDGKGQLEYIDHGTGMNVHGDTVRSFVILDANCATFSGAASIDGQKGYTYTVDVCDYNEPGRNFDNFGIDLSNGYQNSGTITGGNIQLH